MSLIRLIAVEASSLVGHTDGMDIILFDEIWESTAERVRKSLAGGGDADVRINSPGGLVHEGLAVYNLLRSHRGRVTVHIDGLAASIASLIAMAGDRIIMAENAMIMIHAPWMPTAGNADDLRKSADLLDKHQTAMVTAYTRSGASESKIIEWMAAETWFDAREALAAGLVDEIDQPVRMAAHFDLSKFRNAPPTLLEANMGTQNTNAPAEPGKSTPTPSASENAVATERKRAAEIMAACEVAKLPAKFASDLIAQGIGIDQARAKIIDAWAAQDDVGEISSKAPFAYSGARVESGTNGIDDFVAAASDALLLRAGMKPAKLHPAAQDVAQMGIRELAQSCVNRSGSRRGLFGNKDVVRAAMTSSDFPAILEDAIHKSMRAGFEQEPASHREWISTAPVADFRDQVRPILGSAPELELVLEGAEYKHGPMDDDAARYRAKKYGKIVSLTWETLVNDNLGAFLRTQPAMGQAARRREADEVYDLLAANPEMQDGIVLFHADHNNLASSQAEFDVNALSAGRLLMRRQTAKGGGLMSLIPRVLLVAPELETEAEILLRNSTLHRTAATIVQDSVQSPTGSHFEGNTPEWISRLMLVVEPRLDDSQFYLIAAPGQADFLEMGTFEGSPTLTEEEGFDSDVMRWKIRHVFGVGALDWRGAVKVPLD